LEQWPRPAGVGIETGRSLLQLSGPHAGEVFASVEDLTLLAGPVSVPAGGGFTTAAPLGGYLRGQEPAGSAVVVTLTLYVVGTPGTYTLGVTEATSTTSDGQPSPLSAGPLLTITVQGQ
jgi:hypothetical protein